MRARWCATHLFQLHFVILETDGTFISPVCILCFIYYLFFENRTWLQLLYHLHAASKTQQLHTRCIWFLSPLISLLFLPFMIKRPENKQHADLQPYNELWGEKKPAEVAVCHERLCFYFCDVNWMQCRIQVSRWQCNARENVWQSLACWTGDRNHGVGKLKSVPSIFSNWVK